MNISIIDKFFKLLKRKKKNSLSKFIVSYAKQKDFCEIVLNQYNNNLAQADEIKKLFCFYENIVLSQNIYSIIREYIHFFDSIEKNKPLKYKLFVFVAFMINILSFKLGKIK